MDGLEVFDLYQETDLETSKKFIEAEESTLNVQTDKKYTTRDTEWIEMMELVIPHLDHIFRKPNRFIENQEEIIKIEQTRKVSVESIKHLSKNTNLIQTIDENGDVIPSKLLNVRKEESYDTYENRLIYTLMGKIRFFIMRKKTALEAAEANKNEEQNKNNKTMEYKSKSQINDEDVDINVTINSKLNKSEEDQKKEKEEILNRIEAVEKKLSDVESTEVYKILDKLQVTLVSDPVRKTNVILKNVHFQYAMKLWEYLKDNMDEQSNSAEENKDFMDDGNLRKMMDEAFLLQYLIMKTLDQDEKEKQDTKKEIKAILMEQMIDKILDLDEDITEEQLKQLVAEKYEVIKYKKMQVLRDIQNVFKEHIKKYEEMIETEG